jgi:hypothetical protein
MSRTGRRTLRGQLARSAVVHGLMFLLLSVAIVLVPDQPRPESSHVPVPAEDTAGRPLWETVYSERYPGCVSLVLWPMDEQPVALVTRTPAGEVERVAMDEAGRLHWLPAGGARAIGACRR